MKLVYCHLSTYCKHIWSNQWGIGLVTHMCTGYPCICISVCIHKAGVAELTQSCGATINWQDTFLLWKTKFLWALCGDTYLHCSHGSTAYEYYGFSELIHGSIGNLHTHCIRCPYVSKYTYGTEHGHLNKGYMWNLVAIILRNAFRK